MSECTHNCESCGENCAERQMKPEDFLEKPHELSSVRKVVGVVSGKGGVGKSLVTSMLAVLLNPARPPHRHHGRRRDRPVDPQGVRPA